MRVVTLEDHFATLLCNEKRGPLPPPMREILAARGHQLGVSIERELLDLTSSRIKHLDDAGIDVQVISLNMPGTEGFGAADGAAVARDANDRVRSAINEFPDRLQGFAALPTADPPAAAKELERAVKTLGLKGANINGHVQGRYLDDKFFWPIFEAAEALDVPLYLHPCVPHPNVMKTYFAGQETLALGAWGFAMETCTHVLRLITGGVFDAHPRLRLILGHMGEGLPFWLHRLDDNLNGDLGRRGYKRTFAEYLRENIVITTSGNFFTPALICAIMALGIDNILFSVDWPFESNKLACTWLRDLPLSPADKEKIAHKNAERVLKL